MFSKNASGSGNRLSAIASNAEERGGHMNLHSTNCKHPLRPTMPALVIVAVVSGVFGGFVQSMFVTQTASAQRNDANVIRVRAIELIDTNGKRVGYLGADAKNNTGLTLFDTKGKNRMKFLLSGGETPRMAFNDSDESELLSTGLSPNKRPYLMMSDRDFTGRVYLGVAEPDAPDPDWKYDAWVLSFKGNNLRNLVTLGMETGKSGGMIVSDLTGHEWQTPVKP
jgi:hypothetical protein